MSAIGEASQQHERWCSGQHPPTLRCDNILEPLGPDSFGGQDAPHASAALSSRRDGGDAGHVPGCMRDHALSTACEVDAHGAGLARVVAADGLVPIGRASVVPPDADLARVIAAWPGLADVGHVIAAHVERVARAHWRDVAERVLSPDGCADLDRVRVTLHWSTEPGLRVVGAEVCTAVEPVAPTVEQWAKLRAAGVPVVERACDGCEGIYGPGHVFAPCKHQQWPVV